MVAPNCLFTIPACFIYFLFSFGNRWSTLKLWSTCLKCSPKNTFSSLPTESRAPAKIFYASTWSQVITLPNYIFNYIIVMCKHICVYLGIQLHTCYKKLSLFAFVFCNCSYWDMVARCIQFWGFCLFFTAKYGCRNGYICALYAGSSYNHPWLDNKVGKQQLIYKRDCLDSAPSVWLNLVLVFPTGS